MIGEMRDRLTLQKADAIVVTVASLTRAGTTATATTLTAHGYATGDYVTIAGATPSGYNGKVKITVTGTSTFTFSCSGALGSPATGAVTAVYQSDAQGGRRVAWVTFAEVAAEMMPLRAGERLQLAAIQSDTSYRFRIRTRGDVTTKQRARWTPLWPPGASVHLLEVTGVLPYEDGRTYQLLECAESPRA